MKRIRAVYIGNNGGFGFYKSREYLLEVEPISVGIAINAVGDRRDNNGGTRVEYTSMVGFLNNWDMIRNV